jgi:hypothetical protein
MLVAAGVLAAVAAFVGFSLGGPTVALGASVGTLASGLYVWSFLRSHLSQAPRERIFDRGIATGAGLRLLTAAVTGAGMFLVGREAFVAYLAAFGAGFALLLATQAPAVLRKLNRLWADEGREASL